MQPSDSIAAERIHSHSIVPGDFEVMSYTTRLTPLTSLMMHVATRPMKPMPNGSKSRSQLLEIRLDLLEVGGEGIGLVTKDDLGGLHIAQHVTAVLGHPGVGLLRLKDVQPVTHRDAANTALER